jgi:hypothetical protein
MSGLSLLGAVFLLLLAGVAFWNWRPIPVLQWVFVLCLGIGALRLIIGPIRLIVAYYRADKVTLTDHQCAACDHQWQQEDGQVLPSLEVSAPAYEEKSAEGQSQAEEIVNSG